LVKLEILLLSKILGMPYNLEWREYIEAHYHLHSPNMSSHSNAEVNNNSSPGLYLYKFTKHTATPTVSGVQLWHSHVHYWTREYIANWFHTESAAM